MNASAPSPAFTQALQTLAIDATAAEVIGAMTRAAVDHLLIKGPATVHWLYADDPGARLYSDVDILVAPEDFERAGAVLDGLGFTCATTRPDRILRSYAHEFSWRRPGAAEVDLHRGFHGVRDGAALWRALSSDAIRLSVGGHEVCAPDAAGCALIVALHDTSPPRTEQAAEDLRRALRAFDPAVWEEAGRLAAVTGASGHLRLSLRRAGLSESALAQILGPSGDPGATGADQLLVGLSSRAAVNDDRVDVRRAAALVGAMSRSSGAARRRNLIQLAVPPRAEMVRRVAWADRSAAHYLAAVVLRGLRVAADAPAIAALLWSARPTRRNRF